VGHNARATESRRPRLKSAILVQGQTGALQANSRRRVSSRASPTPMNRPQSLAVTSSPHGAIPESTRFAVRWKLAQAAEEQVRPDRQMSHSQLIARLSEKAALPAGDGANARLKHRIRFPVGRAAKAVVVCNEQIRRPINRLNEYHPLLERNSEVWNSPPTAMQRKRKRSDACLKAGSAAIIAMGRLLIVSFETPRVPSIVMALTQLQAAQAAKRAQLIVKRSQPPAPPAGLVTRLQKNGTSAPNVCARPQVPVVVQMARRLVLNRVDATNIPGQV